MFYFYFHLFDYYLFCSCLSRYIGHMNLNHLKLVDRSQIRSRRYTTLETHHIKIAQLSWTMRYHTFVNISIFLTPFTIHHILFCIIDHGGQQYPSLKTFLVNVRLSMCYPNIPTVTLARVYMSFSCFKIFIKRLKYLFCTIYPTMIECVDAFLLKILVSARLDGV